MITINFKKLDILPQDRILDIGCGEGRHTIRACQEKDTRCTGADYVYKNLVQTRDKLNFHQDIGDLSCRGWNLSAMDVTRLPFADSSFDIVICSEVLEHIPDDDKAISELIRVLKPGKTLAVSVPRFWPEKLCWALSKEYTQADMGHIRIYKKQRLLTKIQAHGLIPFSSHHAHAIHTPFWWLKCLVGPERTDSLPVNLYHRILVWEIMKKPVLLKFIDKLLNPVLGKSMVLYFQKPGARQ